MIEKHGRKFASTSELRRYEAATGCDTPSGTEHLLDEAGKFFDWGNAAGDALKAMMDAYERRIRSLCTPEQLEAKPWECAEFIEARRILEAKPNWVIGVPSESGRCPHGVWVADHCWACNLDGSKSNAALERELAIAKKRLWIELEAPTTIGTQSAVAPMTASDFRLMSESEKYGCYASAMRRIAPSARAALTPDEFASVARFLRIAARREQDETGKWLGHQQKQVDLAIKIEGMNAADRTTPTE